MPFRIALATTCHPEDRKITALVDRITARATEHNADIIVFPESLMSRFEEEKHRFLEESQPVDGKFASSIDALAAKHGIWIVYTMNEAHPNNSNPYNTAILADSLGQKRSIYRKVHLFDSNTVKESERMSMANDIVTPVNTPFGNIALAICYDLRFPEYARKQTLNGCELLIYPAAWVDGPSKELQWKTLLQARAIENEIFVVGVSRADKGYVGTGYVFAPNGEQLAQRLDDELLIAEIDTSEIEKMRAAIPCLEHRRPELY